jgi:hypothetical protein
VTHELCFWAVVNEKQNVLVLESLRICTDLLAPKGIFITKVRFKERCQYLKEIFSISMSNISSHEENIMIVCCWFR